MASWQGLRPRTHLSITAGAVIVVLAFAALLYFRPAVAPVERETFETPTLPVSVTSTYEEGVHTLTGAATLRNRCQRLDAVATLDETMTPALIRIDVTSEHDEGICLEIPEERTFEIEVEGPENARVQIFVNGLPQDGDAF